MFSAVDIGSNTVRMLFATASNNRIEPIAYYRKITRLAGGATRFNGLTLEAIERTLNAMDEVAALLNTHKPKSVKIVATEALRGAVNGPQVAQLLSRRCGFEVTIIRGDEEARLCATGVLSGLNPRPAHGLIFDIGGGSTEFVVVQDGTVRQSFSYPVGAVLLAEAGSAADGMRHKLLADLVGDLQRCGCFETVARSDCELIGTAGTVTTLAALQMQMRVYDWRRVNNYSISREELKLLFGRMSGLSPRQREELDGMEKGRGDLILPGLQLVLGIMDTFSVSTLRVSDFGLLEGVILSLAQQDIRQTERI